MRHTFLKYTSSLFILCLFIFSACSSDPETDECADTISSLMAQITSSEVAFCQGQELDLMFTGTPDATITYSLNGVDETITLNATGDATVSVSPTETSKYELESIALDGCSKTLTGSARVELGGSVINQQIIGTWAIWNIHDNTDGLTITFKDDGTAISPPNASFTKYSTTLGEFSDGVDWEYDDLNNHFIIKITWSGFGQPYRHEVDFVSCDEIILLDVTSVTTPPMEYRFTRL